MVFFAGFPVSRYDALTRQPRPAMLGVGGGKPYIEAVFRGRGGRRGDAAFGPQQRQEEEQPWNSGW